jgi:chromosome partitioning protein
VSSLTERSSTVAPAVPVTLEQIDEMAKSAMVALEKARARMLRPDAAKQPPVFSGAQLADLCAMKHSAFSFHRAKGEMPPGRVVNRARREFTLAEARIWVRHFRRDFLKPPGETAVTLATGLFKGGTGKTTTSVTLAQGLSLRGHRVLLIDLDPQGSLTTLMGLLPNVDVRGQHTLLGLFAGDESSVRYAIRPTYWDGIDLIPASASLFGAEFFLPSRQKDDKSLRFWDVLRDGLRDVVGEYDTIIIDTPPALSYVTSNAFLAADALITPMSLGMMDFSSSAFFWGLFSEITESFRKHGLEKEYGFLHTVLNKVVAQDQTGEYIRRRVIEAYGEHVLPEELPNTTVAGVASAEFGTVYDLKGDYLYGKAYRRAREAYDALVGRLELSVRSVWALRQLQAASALERGPVLERAA